MDTIGTEDDLSCFMDFSSLFVHRKKLTSKQMDGLYGMVEGFANNKDPQEYCRLPFFLYCFFIRNVSSVFGVEQRLFYCL